jgi:subtilisin family serine protease
MTHGRFGFRTLMLVAGLTSMTMVGCKDDPPTALSEPAKFTLVSGDAQSANNAALALPLVVKITDVQGNPKSGVTVNWTTSDPTSTLSAATSTTNDQGTAQITWTLGTGTGRQTVTATTPSIPGAQVVFQANNLYTVPAKLTLVSGDAQTGNGDLLATPLVVKVSDVNGQPKAGVTVTWAASDATSTLSAATSTTDAQGQASVTWTLGASAGRQTVTATTAALPGAQVTFGATNGGVISGGLTVQAAPPVAFAALLSKVTGGDALNASAKSQRTVNQPSVSAQRLGKATRRLIVQFKPVGGASILARGAGAVQANMTVMKRGLATLLSSRVVTRPEMSPAILAARVTVPAGQSMEAAAAALRADASVLSVTEDRIVPMLAPYAAYPAAAVAKAVADAGAQAIGGALAGPLPNDPFLPNALWHYNLVDAPRAWKAQTGSNTVLVAVVDNGIRYEHESFNVTQQNLTHDGYNFVSGGDLLDAPEPVCSPSGPLGTTTTLHENGPSPDPTQPDDLAWTGSCWSRSTVGNHGLHVAGTIGAPGNDAIGVNGLNWKVSIRPVRVLDITGSGSYYDIAQGVLYAAGLPAASDTLGGTVTAPSRAAVINMSLGGSGNAPVLRDAVTAATNAGSLIVASAGNSESSAPSYPAAYPEVLAVSAVGPDLSISSYTNVGGNVSLAAPGGNFRSSGSSGVVSSTWNYVTGASSYAYYQGTSMAAPHVVGVAALTLAANPGMTNAQLRARLQNTAVHVGAPGRNDQYGYGLVNAYNAVTGTQGPVRATYVRIVNAANGATVQQVAANADGSYSVSRLPVGSYLVYGGQDEDGDKQIGMPGRRFGWYGPAGNPTPVTIASGGNVSASLNIGTPIESKPHSTTATANRLSLNTYMVGQITATDAAAQYYMVQIPAAGTYYFEAAGVLGACSLGIELRVRLDLVNAAGTSLVTTPANCANFGASGLRAQLGVAGVPAGTYYVKISGVAASNFGQYRVWVRDQP